MESGISPMLLLGIVLGYFSLLLLISFRSGKDQSNSSFFLGQRKAPWMLVAIGMVGATLSGVTFISVPGWVGASQFSYMQMVLGYIIGYFVIATVLMPMYYKMGLTSIYGYLESRFGMVSYKTGAAFFLLSRVIGASFRLYLVALVLDTFVLGPMGVPFWVAVLLILGFIWLYTHRGGIRTIIFTDTLQTLAMVGAVLMTIWAVMGHFEWSVGETISRLRGEEMTQIFFFDGGWEDNKNFFKRFIAGAFIALVMTGLDQDMMQKNLSCRSIGDAQKNMFWFTGILVVAKLVFLCLGALLFLYMTDVGMEMPTRVVGEQVRAATDLIYPQIALEYLPTGIGVLFVLGLLAAACSSADSAMTSLTTSFCVDFLGFERVEGDPDRRLLVRRKVHIGCATVLFVVIMTFWRLNDAAVIESIFKMAGYTYGPLLGMFAYGFLTRRQTWDAGVWLACILAPILTFVVVRNSEAWLGGYKFDFEHLVLNGLLTFVFMWILTLFRRP